MRLVLLILAALLAAPAPEVARAAQPAVGDIGVNLTDYLTVNSTEIPFVDLFRQSAPWTFEDKPGAIKGAASAELGASVVGPDGWVQSLRSDQRAATKMLGSGDDRYPDGVYTVLYDGEGELTFAAPSRVAGRRVGRVDVQVLHGSARTWGLRLTIERMNPANPIRNIRVILPGYLETYQTNPWYPPFLKMLKPFKTLRFMGWQAINFDMQKEWSERRLPTYATQASPPGYQASPLIRGVSFEDIIALANELDATPWVNVPTAASDDYVREMAKLFHRTLKPGLHPMLEYSNEIWNPSFAFTFCTVRERGLSLAPAAQAGEPCTRNAEGGFVLPARAFEGVAGYRYYALRTSQIFDIWDAEYGSEKAKTIHVVAQWNGVPQEIQEIMSFGQSVGKLASKADVIATGGYVSASYTWVRAIQKGQLTWEQVAQMSPADVTRTMVESIDTELAPRFRSERAAAQKWGLGLVVYEGGDGNTAFQVPKPYQETVVRLMIAAAQDPGMAEVYTRLLDVWKASGGSLFTQFYDVGAPGVFGLWGLLGYQDQPLDSSQKYRAMVDWSKANGK